MNSWVTCTSSGRVRIRIWTLGFVARRANHCTTRGNLEGQGSNPGHDVRKNVFPKWINSSCALEEWQYYPPLRHSWQRLHHLPDPFRLPTYKAFLVQVFLEGTRCLSSRHSQACLYSLLQSFSKFNFIYSEFSFPKVN